MKPAPVNEACSPAFRCLLACLVDDHEAIACNLTASTEAGEDPVALAAEHRLAPLLYQRLHSAALLEQLPSEQRERLQSLNRRIMLRQATAYDGVHAVLDFLRASDLDALPIKGVALAALLAPAPLLRQMDDVDLLVDPESLQTAEHALRTAGYVAAPGRWSPTPWEHHLPLLQKGSVGVELHWRLWPVSPLQPFSLPSLDQLWARREHASLLERDLTIPAKADQLLMLVAAMAHDGFSTRLRHWADVHWLTQRFTDQDWGRVQEFASQMHMQGLLAIVLRFVEELTGVACPVACGDPEGAWQCLRPLLWRRLMEPDPLRPSLWLRVVLSGHRPADDWSESLPRYLREQLPQGQSAIALRRIGGGFAAAGKLFARLGTLALSGRARRALREELQIGSVLWQLAEEDRNH